MSKPEPDPQPPPPARPEPAPPFPPSHELDPRTLPFDPFAEYDRLGRKQPHRLSIAALTMKFPGMLRRTRVVPLSAVVEEASDGEGEYALVKCPCGASPIIRREIEKCPGCDRWYYLVIRVYVVYGAMEMPPLPTTAA